MARRCLMALAVLALGQATFAAQSFLYVSSIGTDQVLRYDAATGAFLNVAASGGGLDAPAGLAIHPTSGDLLVAGAVNNAVLRFNPGTGAFISTFTSGGSLTTPDGMAFGPDGSLYVSGGTANNVQRFNGTTGAFQNIFASGPAGLLNPALFDVKFGGPSGDLYVTNFGIQLAPFAIINTLRRHNGATGAFVWNSTGGSLNVPAGIAFGPDGNVYVASSAGDAVLRFNATTGAFVSTFITAGSGGLDRPYGLAFGPDGNLYVASYGGSAATSFVKRYNGTTGAFIDNFASTGGLNNPSYILFSAAVIPEPTTLLLGGLGLAGVAWISRRRRPEGETEEA